MFNIEGCKSEPVGGVARFITMVKHQISAADGANILVAFAGDAFSPAPLSHYTSGKEIPPVLNATGVTVACVGKFSKMFLWKCTFSKWHAHGAVDASPKEPFSGLSKNIILIHC